MVTDRASSIRRLAAIGAALALVLGACGPSGSPSALPPGPTLAATPTALATAGPSQDAAAIYGAIAAQVEAIRGLRPTSDVTPVVIDAAQLRTNLTADFDRNNPPSVVRFTQQLYVELGLLPAAASLRDAYLDLQSDQVAGYYSAAHKQLFVVSRSGGIGPTQRVTYAHEFTHELQDQHYDLVKLLGTATDQGDRSLARLGLIEGDAVTTQATWTTENLTPADLAQLLADASDPAALAALQDAPAILRTTALYPYIDGLAFVRSLMAGGGIKTVDLAFADPPNSTAQVLHPELYAARVQPMAVDLPATLATAAGAGWTLLGEDTLGELQLRGWLAADGVDSATAATAAAGWAADRVAILDGPNGQVALAMVIRWTSAADVAEFSSAYKVASPKIAGASFDDDALGADTVGIFIAPTMTAAEALDRALRR